MFKALWWQGAPWGANDCAGVGADCAHVLGATQLTYDEAILDPDALLAPLEASPTFDWFLEEFIDDSAGEIATVVRSPDGAMIASLLAQAIRSVFRFSPMEGDASAALRRSPHDYDLVRRFLASGLVVANTFYGPVSFDAFGQNEGKVPTTIQVSDGGAAELVLSDPSIFDATRLSDDVTLAFAPSSTRRPAPSPSPLRAAAGPTSSPSNGVTPTACSARPGSATATRRAAARAARAAAAAAVAAARLHRPITIGVVGAVAVVILLLSLWRWQYKKRKRAVRHRAE